MFNMGNDLAHHNALHVILHPQISCNIKYPRNVVCLHNCKLHVCVCVCVCVCIYVCVYIYIYIYIYNK